MTTKTYRFKYEEDQDTLDFRAILAEVYFDDGGNGISVWSKTDNQDQDEPPEATVILDEDAAIALRDFLIFCFPLNPRDP